MTRILLQIFCVFLVISGLVEAFNFREQYSSLDKDYSKFGKYRRFIHQNKLYQKIFHKFGEHVDMLSSEEEEINKVIPPSIVDGNEFIINGDLKKLTTMSQDIPNVSKIYISVKNPVSIENRIGSSEQQSTSKKSLDNNDVPTSSSSYEEHSEEKRLTPLEEHNLIASKDTTSEDTLSLGLASSTSSKDETVKEITFSEVASSASNEDTTFEHTVSSEVTNSASRGDATSDDTVLFEIANSTSIEDTDFELTVPSEVASSTLSKDETFELTVSSAASGKDTTFEHTVISGIANSTSSKDTTFENAVHSELTSEITTFKASEVASSMSSEETTFEHTVSPKVTSSTSNKNITSKDNPSVFSELTTSTSNTDKASIFSEAVNSTSSKDSASETTHSVPLDVISSIRTNEDETARTMKIETTSVKDNPSTDDMTPSTSDPLLKSTDLDVSLTTHGDLTFPSPKNDQTTSNIVSTLDDVSKDATVKDIENIISSEHVIEIPAIRTVRMIVSVVFLAVALVAIAVLTIYMIKIKRKEVEYDQLLLLR